MAESQSSEHVTYCFILMLMQNLQISGNVTVDTKSGGACSPMLGAGRM